MALVHGCSQSGHILADAFVHSGMHIGASQDNMQHSELWADVPACCLCAGKLHSIYKLVFSTYVPTVLLCWQHRSAEVQTFIIIRTRWII